MQAAAKFCENEQASTHLVFLIIRIRTEGKFLIEWDHLMPLHLDESVCISVLSNKFTVTQNKQNTTTTTKPFNWNNFFQAKCIHEITSLSLVFLSFFPLT